jgi:hypothetical protein
VKTYHLWGMVIGAAAIIFGLARLGAHATSAIVQIVAGVGLLALSLYWFHRPDKTDENETPP